MVLLWLVGFVSVARTAEPTEPGLVAFARLYGVLRYFHPSDEAAALDWNRFAVLGAHELRGVDDPAAIEAGLAALVTPFAPSVRLGRPPLAAPRVAGGCGLVAWRHLGPGFEGGGGGAYRSWRTNRAPQGSPAQEYGSFYQVVGVEGWVGRRFRLTGRVRAQPGGRAGVWARVDRAEGGPGFFDNMWGRPVTSTRWTEARVEGTIVEGATRLVVGGLAWGGADASFDAFVLEAQAADGSWSPVPLADPGFEARDPPWNPGVAPDRDSGAEGVTLSRAEEPWEGRRALTLERAKTWSRRTFDTKPVAGDFAEAELGAGLVALVPLVLPSARGHTRPVGDPGALADRLDALPPPAPQDPDVQLADVIVAWATLGQFYPYFDVVDADWDGALARALQQPAVGVEALLVELRDGHAKVTPARWARKEDLAVRLGWVEGAVVALASGVPGLARGDVVRTIDGVSVEAALEAALAHTSGSEGWRHFQAVRSLTRGPPGVPGWLGVDREGGVVEVEVPRGSAPPDPARPAPIAELSPGTCYVDLDRAEVAELRARLPELAAAKGLVVDGRGYPNSNHFLLQHLLDGPEQDEWMFIPELVRPALPGLGRPEPAWTGFGWNLRPAAPRFGGKVVFLSGPGAISYAESVLGYAEAFGLPVVGEPSAGTNGNIRTFFLPSGRQVTFTGMRVLRHDGRPFHLEGVRPTVPVAPTLAGVRAGRDEVLERGLELAGAVDPATGAR